MTMAIFELIIWLIAGILTIVTLITDNIDGVYVTDYILCWIALLFNVVTKIIQQYDAKEIFKKNKHERKL